MANISNKGFVDKRDKNQGSNWRCYCFLLKKKLLEPYAQCHVFAQSSPGRRPSDKYPVNISHRSRFV